MESSLSPKLQSSLNNMSKWQDLNVIIKSLYFPVSLQTSSIQIPKEWCQTNPATRTDCRKVSNILPLRHILPLDNKQGAVMYGSFPTTPQTVEVKQKKMPPQFWSLNERLLAISSSSKLPFLSFCISLMNSSANTKTVRNWGRVAVNKKFGAQNSHRNKYINVLLDICIKKTCSNTFSLFDWKPVPNRSVVCATITTENHQRVQLRHEMTVTTFTLH